MSEELQSLPQEAGIVQPSVPEAWQGRGDRRSLLGDVAVAGLRVDYNDIELAENPFEPIRSTQRTSCGGASTLGWVAHAQPSR